MAEAGTHEYAAVVLNLRFPALRGLLVAAVLTLQACGGEGPAAVTPDAEESKPRNAEQIAVSLVQGRIVARIFVERLRDHPVGPKLLKLGPVPDLLEGSKLDPLRDIQRAVIVSNNAREERAIVFAEHSVPSDQIPALVAELADKSEPKGQVIGGAPNWTVKVSKKGREGVVCFVPPRFVVILPMDLQDKCDAFSETGGLVGPIADEAATIVVSQPADALRARRVPAVPPTVTELNAKVVLDKDGGATIDTVGQSTREAAAGDAAMMTKGLDEATSVNLGIIRIRAFGPVVFRPEEDKVKSTLKLTSAELDQILSLADSMID